MGFNSAFKGLMSYYVNLGGFMPSCLEVAKFYAILYTYGRGYALFCKCYRLHTNLLKRDKTLRHIVYIWQIVRHLVYIWQGLPHRGPEVVVPVFLKRKVMFIIEVKEYNSNFLSNLAFHLLLNTVPLPCMYLRTLGKSTVHTCTGPEALYRPYSP